MPRDPNKNPLEEGKKTSALIPPDLISPLEESPLGQSKTIVEALRFYFTEKPRIEEYQEKILSYEKRESSSLQKIAVLEARLSEFEFLKNTLSRSQDQYQQLMDQQEKHVIQVQKMLTQRDEEIRQREEIIRSKEEKIFLLEEKKKKKWWKPF